jgi:ubiquinone/menaquinone biosynthesis C-methylase UbiE
MAEETIERAVDPAQVYQARFVPMLFAPWTGEILDRVGLETGQALLDVACGTGVVTRDAAARLRGSGRVVGLDMNPRMLDVARGVEAPFADTIEWIEGNALALPFDDATFDAVTCQHGLQFFPDKLAAVREMRRVSKPGGRAGILVWSHLSRQPLFAALNEASTRVLGFPAFMAPFTYPSAEDLAGLLREAGFCEARVDAVTKEHVYDDPAGFVPMQVMASASVLPELRDRPREELAAIIAAIEAEARPTLDAMTVDGILRFDGEAHIGIGVA